MSGSLRRPVYNAQPIGSVQALARALGVSESDLYTFAADADNLYRLAKAIIKPDGSTRQPFDAKPPLKHVHRRIKEHIFRRVEFPPYLTGSVRGRDYVTNAKLHLNKKIVICEDIQSFFPSVKAALVYDVWLDFFCFHPTVADLLTKLTTKEGALPQGAITSSYLANLVLFKWEPVLYEQLTSESVSYSRYVDDMALSSAEFLPRDRQTKILAAVHGMLAKAGLRAKRKKHEIFSSRQTMITTKLVVNKKVSLPMKQRSAIRTAVYQLERLLRAGAPAEEIGTQLGTIAGRVNNLRRFHEAEGNALAKRVDAVRAQHLSRGSTPTAPTKRQ